VDHRFRLICSGETPAPLAGPFSASGRFATGAERF
jgi:hypothetical protein